MGLGGDGVGARPDPSCVSSRVLGRPGPGPDRLGLKCYLAWGGTRVVVVVGGKGVISCTSNITFHPWYRKKIYIYSSILTFQYASFGDDEIGKMLYR